MSNQHAPVMAVIDPTVPGQPALAKAADYARRVGAPLVMLACIFDPYVAGERFYDGTDLKKLRKQAIDRQLQGLRELARPLRAQGLEVTCRAVWDHPLHEAIIREGHRCSPAVIVKDTHYHSVVSRAIYTNTDWHLIRESPYTLWLVKPGSPPQHASIIAAVDPLHEHDKPAALDRRILDTAQAFSVLYDERLHLVHAYVVEPAPTGAAFPFGAVMPVIVDERLLSDLQDRHRNALERLAADVGLPGEQVHLKRGAAFDVVPALARELNAAAVVMGAISRTRLKRAFIGSTAERLLDRLPCDVIIVKPEEFVSPVTSRGKAAGYLSRSARR